jgi:hypothetical protein
MESLPYLPHPMRTLRQGVIHEKSAPEVLPYLSDEIDFFREKLSEQVWFHGREHSLQKKAPSSKKNSFHNCVCVWVFVSLYAQSDSIEEMSEKGKDLIAHVMDVEMERVQYLLAEYHRVRLRKVWNTATREETVFFPIFMCPDY